MFQRANRRNLVASRANSFRKCKLFLAGFRVYFHTYFVTVNDHNFHYNHPHLDHAHDIDQPPAQRRDSMAAASSLIVISNRWDLECDDGVQSSWQQDCQRQWWLHWIWPETPRLPFTLSRNEEGVLIRKAAAGEMLDHWSLINLTAWSGRQWGWLGVNLSFKINENILGPKPEQV